MQQIIAHPKPPLVAVGRRVHDPDPGAWAYRRQRLLLTPVYQRLVRWGGVGAVLVLALLWGLSNPERRVQAYTMVQTVHSAVTAGSRGHVVAQYQITGTTTQAVHGQIATLIPRHGGGRVDLDALRLGVEGLPAVASARLHLLPDGRLDVAVREVPPRFAWRTADGLFALDSKGTVLYPMAKADGLIQLAGQGAPAQAGEALRLFTALTPLKDQVAGLVRVGGRRWNVALHGNRHFLLPEVGPEAALTQIIALYDSGQLPLSHIIHADFRNPRRPTLRLHSDVARALAGKRPISYKGRANDTV